MKFLFATAIAVLSLNAFAGNGSLLQDSLIQSVTAPVSHTSELKTTAVVVTQRGVVLNAEIDTSSGKTVSAYAVDQLPAEQLKKIEALIGKAALGKKETLVSGGFHCQAASPFATTYSADGGSVFLKEERLCIDPTVNTTPESQELVTILKDIEQNVNKVNTTTGITVLSCQSYPQVADAGYNVRVVKTDTALLALVGEESFIGNKDLGHFAVKQLHFQDSSRYLDVNTNGRVLSLYVNFRNPIKLENGIHQFQGYFAAVTAGTPVSGKVACTPIRR